MFAYVITSLANTPSVATPRLHNDASRASQRSAVPLAASSHDTHDTSVSYITLFAASSPMSEYLLDVGRSWLVPVGSRILYILNYPVIHNGDRRIIASARVDV
ncbi:unnamed protein product [Chrysodeixis includens]|uniref:Uncharacterized protein n=1 Tax=Chrysodeixis includens TaxID=689277 RepID=A0A9N8KTS3_CHRIL|nr:unnamed protein product [Chrysodeixis includens]